MPPQHMILKAKRFDLHAGIRMWGGYPAVARMLERQRPERVPVGLHTDLSCFGLRQICKQSVEFRARQGKGNHCTADVSPVRCCYLVGRDAVHDVAALLASPLHALHTCLPAVQTSAATFSLGLALRLSTCATTCCWPCLHRGHPQ